MNCFHLLKAAERMTFGNEFTDGSLVKRSSDQQHNIVNHVAVPAAQPHQPQVALPSTWLLMTMRTFSHIWATFTVNVLRI